MPGRSRDLTNRTIHVQKSIESLMECAGCWSTESDRKLNVEALGLEGIGGYFKELIRGRADYYAAYRFKNVLSNKNAIGRFLSTFKKSEQIWPVS